MNKRTLRLILTALVLLLSLPFAIWGFKSNASVIREHAVSSVELDEVLLPHPTLTPAPVSTPGSSPYVSPPIAAPPPVENLIDATVPEHRRFTLEFPPKIREGDSGIIRVSLDIDEIAYAAPTLIASKNSTISNPVDIPNLYETHAIVAEANLDLAGMDVQPPGMVSESMSQGKPVTFLWSIRPRGAGTYEGVVWLHLRLIPKNGGAETRVVLTAQPIEIRTTLLFGLSGSSARWFGGIGSLIGTVVGFPFLEDIVRWTANRLKPRKKR